MPARIGTAFGVTRRARRWPPNTDGDQLARLLLRPACHVERLTRAEMPQPIPTLTSRHVTYLTPRWMSTRWRR